MALHDVDKSGLGREAPIINAHDSTGVPRMAQGTTSVNPVTEATEVNGFIKTADSRAMVNDGADNRVSLGGHTDSSFGLKISQNGFNVDTATPAQLLFDSNQTAFRIVDSTATVVADETLTDSPDIQVAIDLISAEGGGVILLKNGTYMMNSDIVLSDNITLQGETANGAIIDFQNTAHQIITEAESVYDTGTVLLTAGSANVTGVGTNWTSALAGQQIQLIGAWYLIDSINSPTSLTLDTPFTQITVNLETTGGAVFPIPLPTTFGAVTGSNYTITTPVVGTSIINLTVQNSTHSNGAVYFHNTQSSFYNTVNVFSSAIGAFFDGTSLVTAQGFFSQDCTVGIRVDNSGIWTITNWETFDCGVGILANNFVNTSVNNFTLSSSTGNNATLNNCAQWGFYDATNLLAGGNGLELTDCSDIEIFAMNIQNCAGDGAKLGANNTRISINNVTLFENEGYGVDISSSNDDRNTITGCFFVANIMGDLFDSGIHTIDANNQKQT